MSGMDLRRARLEAYALNNEACVLCLDFVAKQHRALVSLEEDKKALDELVTKLLKIENDWRALGLKSDTC